MSVALQEGIQDIGSLCLGYLRALGEAGSDDLSTFDADLI
jgi:hypothetical protein